MTRAELRRDGERLLEAIDTGSPRTNVARAFVEAALRELSRDELYVNEERTILFRRYADSDTAEVATRETPAHTWGPPTSMERQ